MTQQHMASAPRKVALALQGGGSHGAFTWGVLDRMLTETAIDIIGVTGTSAGAINAVLLADGIVRGGPDEARQRLRQFWQTVGKMVDLATFCGLCQVKPLRASLSKKLRSIKCTTS
jgi:NTE family protein